MNLLGGYLPLLVVTVAPFTTSKVKAQITFK